MKYIMFNPLKDLSEAYDRAENFIAIDDVMGIDHTRILNEIKDKPFFEPCPVRDRKPKGG